MGNEVSIKDAMQAFEELKEVLESGQSETAEAKQKIEKINTALDKHEDQNQKNLLALERSKTEAEEAKKRIDEIELQLSRQSQVNSKNYKDTPEYKALNAWARDGDRLDPEIKADLRTDSDVSGGVLVSRVLSNEITKAITEISPIRSVARVRSINAKTIDYPVRKTIPTATYEGEGEASANSSSSYGMESLTTHAQTITTATTLDLLNEEGFDIEQEMANDATEGFAFGEGKNFVTGDGVKKPHGLLQNATMLANARDSQTSGALDTDDILLVQGDLKTGYNPVFLLNRRTLATLRTQKGNGQYLWLPAINGAATSTIAGDPYVLTNDMPDIAIGAHPVLYGDLRRGYQIIDRTALSVVRDDLTRKKERMVEFTWHRWNTGQVILPEAMKLIIIKA